MQPKLQAVDSRISTRAALYQELALSAWDDGVKPDPRVYSSQ